MALWQNTRVCTYKMRLRSWSPFGRFGSSSPRRSRASRSTPRGSQVYPCEVSRMRQHPVERHRNWPEKLGSSPQKQKSHGPIMVMATAGRDFVRKHKGPILPIVRPCGLVIDLKARSNCGHERLVGKGPLAGSLFLQLLFGGMLDPFPQTSGNVGFLLGLPVDPKEFERLDLNNCECVELRDHCDR